MTHAHSSDPPEIRVLAALMSGTATVADIAMQTGQPGSVVGPILEQALAEQTVTRINLAHAPSYSLTPKGLHAVGVHRGIQGGAAQVDPGAAGPMLMEEYDAAREEAGRPAEDPTPDRVPAALDDAGNPQTGPVDVGPERRKVQWRHVVYAVAYVLLGLFLLLFQPVIGLLTLVAGLVLGGYTLRPLFRSGSVGVTDR